MDSSDRLPARNAPFHTPETASTHSISRQGRAQMFFPLPADIDKFIRTQVVQSRILRINQALCANSQI